MARIAAIGRPPRAELRRTGRDHTIANLISGDPGADFRNNAGDLMAEDDRRLLRHGRKERPVDHAAIAVAQARTLDGDDDLARARPRILALDKLQGLVGIRKQPSFHAVPPIYAPASAE